MGQKTVAQGLILWSGSSPAEPTWEDLESLRQQFPRAAAWGQAATKQGGMLVTHCQPQLRLKKKKQHQLKLVSTIGRLLQDQI